MIRAKSARDRSEWRVRRWLGPKPECSAQAEPCQMPNRECICMPRPKRGGRPRPNSCQTPNGACFMHTPSQSNVLGPRYGLMKTLILAKHKLDMPLGLVSYLFIPSSKILGMRQVNFFYKYIINYITTVFSFLYPSNEGQVHTLLKIWHLASTSINIILREFIFLI